MIRFCVLGQKDWRKKDNKKKNIICNGGENSLILVVISLKVEKLQSLLLWEHTSCNLLSMWGKKMSPASITLSARVFYTNIVNMYALKCNGEKNCLSKKLF